MRDRERMSEKSVWLSARERERESGVLNCLVVSILADRMREMGWEALN